ncbi:hypothetical protein HDIA_0481 [Hartmannibacter diazotrophicus]|uniref:VIT family protein n=1 Tax=Hartmannibacter diazotrophicus TaxID=1482074 RepID=A0A2C9D126_9HYPH|nr:hypothetical protein HDIA_0481 [Hartmannibacter diazotrophicus]
MSEIGTKADRQTVLTYIQPGLAGLIDGSISTLAPVFATAFSTHDTATTFKVGLATALGAGISMGITEIASDDGGISGRGSPVKRGLTVGLMTAAGGLAHSLPFLISKFQSALILASAFIALELMLITLVQNRYMGTPIPRALIQVVVGGIIVLAVGVQIGGT